MQKETKDFKQMLAAYYYHLEQIKNAFPDGELIKKTQAARFLGIDARTFAKRFSLTSKTHISRTSLAMQLGGWASKQKD